MELLQLKILNRTVRKKIKKIDFYVISEKTGISPSRIFLWKKDKCDLNEKEILILIDKFSDEG